MAQQTKNVAAFSPAADGGIFYAPKGTALPTNATTALSASFKGLGYANVDGVAPAYDEASTDTVHAWGGDAVLELTTELGVARYEFTLIEVFAPNVNEFVFGSDATVTPAATGTGTTIAIADSGTNPDDCVMVFDMVYKGKKARIVIPDAQPKITGGNALVHTGEAGWTVQATCLKDSSGKRQYVYMVNDDAL